MNARKLVSMGFAGVAMLFILGCETELDTMKVKEIRLSSPALEIQELSERVLTANLLPNFADIAGRINDITVGTPPAGLTGEEQAAWTTAREAVVAANKALVTWESDNPAVATVTKADGNQLQATVKAVGVESGKNQSLANIRVVIAEEGVAGVAAITVKKATEYTLKVRTNPHGSDAPSNDQTTANSAKILQWKGEKWDGTATTTLYPESITAPHVLTIKNNETGALLGGANANGGGHMTNSTMVYLTTGIKPPFTFQVTLNLKEVVSSSGTSSGVEVWISRDADTPVPVGSTVSYRHAGVRWFGSSQIQAVFMDSATTAANNAEGPNMRNMNSAQAFPINQPVTLEIEHTGEHYVIRYPGAPANGISDSGYSGTQKINDVLVDPAADYFPGFHVSGATVDITGVKVIKD